MKADRKFLLILLIELLLLCGTVVWAYLGVRSFGPIDISVEDWTCPYTVYRDGAFTVGEELVDSGKEITFLYGPGLPLKKGSYSANIQYEAERDQSCMASGRNLITPLIIPADFVHASEGILSSNKDTIRYKFEIPEDVNKFNLNITYNGLGNFRIKSISIQQTNTFYKRTCASVLFLMLGIDLLYLLSKRSKKTKSLVFLICVIGFLSSIPLFFRTVGLYTGDMEFHFIRIDAIANAIRDRQFPPRISSLWMDGYGFPASIYYNDILLLFPAILRLLGYDLHVALKAYILAVNLLTTAISLWSFNKIFRVSIQNPITKSGIPAKAGGQFPSAQAPRENRPRTSSEQLIFRNNKIAVLVTISYVLAPFRMGDMYIHRALGEFTAMTFLPLIACALVQIYTENPDDWKKYRRSGILLSLGITGVVSSHTVSLVMVVFFFAVIGLILFKKTFRKNTLRLWFETALLSVFLNAYFLVPFFDYYLNVDTLITQNTAVRGAAMIQNYGLSLGRLLAFFPSAFTDLKSMPYTPGLLLTAAFVTGCYVYYRERDRKLLTYLILSGIAIFLTMDCFPWNFLEAHTRLGSMLAQIQYPSRFLSIADICLCVLLGGLCLYFEKHEELFRKRIGMLIVVLNLVFLIFFVSDFSVGRKAVNKFETESLNTFLTSLHYLPAGASIERYDYTKGILSEGIDRAEILNQKTHSMLLHAESAGGGTLEVPVLNYKGYHVTDPAGNEYPIRFGTNCRICFDIPAGFNDDLLVAFREPAYWYAAIAVSAVSWILLIILIKKTRGKLLPSVSSFL